MHHQARRFVNHQQRLILVHNGDIEGFSAWTRRTRGGDMHGNAIPTAYAITRCGVGMGGLHLPFLQQAL